MLPVKHPEPDPILDWFLSQRQSAPAEKQPLTEQERDMLLDRFGVSRDTWDAIPRLRERSA